MLLSLLACILTPAEYEGLREALMDADGDGQRSLVYGGLDCDDAEATTHVGASEACDGADNDCDGDIDEGWYVDEDGDGWTSIDDEGACAQGRAGTPEPGGDCDDARIDVNPGSVPLCEPGGEDLNCDGVDDSVDQYDGDLDGFADCVDDCSVDDPSLPVLVWRDQDADGWGDPESPHPEPVCEIPVGYVPSDGDCDDSDETLNPSTPWYVDGDGDGFGAGDQTVASCLQPSGYSRSSEDCDDDDQATFPGAAEVCGDGVINDCSAAETDECGAWGSWQLVDESPAVASSDSLLRVGWLVEPIGLFGNGAPDLALATAYRLYVFKGPVAAGQTEAAADVSLSLRAGAVAVGDISEDGQTDLLVSTEGSARGYLGPLDLTVQASDYSFKLTRDFTGSSTYTDDILARDVDADGHVDLISTAVRYPHGLHKAGAVGVLLGPLTSSMTWGSDSPLELQVEGTVQQEVGRSLGLGDVNGDGLDDSVWWTLTGDVANDRFGAHLVVADLSGDGLADIVTSAPAADAYSGACYVFSGAATATDVSAGAANAKVHGPVDGSLGPITMDGDLDGDGWLDLVAGAPTYDSDGAVLVFRGPLTGSRVAEDADAWWDGPSSVSYAGADVGVTDMDGDGFADALVGAPNYKYGAVYLMLGGPDY